MTLYLIVPDDENEKCDKWDGTIADGNLQAVLALRDSGPNSVAYEVDRRDVKNVVVAGYCDNNGEIVWKP